MLRKWLTPGLGVKRWIIVLLMGIALIASGIAFALIRWLGAMIDRTVGWPEIALALGVGAAAVGVALIKLSQNLLAPYRLNQRGHVIDVVYEHTKRSRGIQVVAIGGGTGLPSVLRGLKPYTRNITAIVTVADDGGSSGRLRRELGVLPPGDLRNNIAALADDESLMTKLFQYRFKNGDLGGHAFGNLFIAALAGVAGSLEVALTEVSRVLNIQGRVLPSTIQQVDLIATVRMRDKPRTLRVHGESKISEIGGQIEEIALSPADVPAYAESVRALLDASLIVIGPGSLYTSILPNLMVGGIADALRATRAYKVYVCNVAQQPGETEDYTVAEHVLALEKHIGRGVFQTVLANHTYPSLNAGENTVYVPAAPSNHEILQRYEVRYTDLTDAERPWRHDPVKLARALLSLNDAEKTGEPPAEPVFAKV